MILYRQPFDLSVRLRQNPHNVYTWHERVKLFEGKPKKVRFNMQEAKRFSYEKWIICIISITTPQIVETYTQAIKTIDPKNNNGKFYTIWLEFAKYYEQAGQLDDVGG